MRISWREELHRDEATLRAFERRRRVVFIGLLGASIGFLLLWGNRSDSGPIAVGISQLTRPFVQLDERISMWLTGQTDRLSDLLTDAGEIARLREENLRLKADLQERELADHSGRGSLSAPSETRSVRVVPARVIGRRDTHFQWLVINRGAVDGLEPYDAVITSEGAVGQVDRVLPGVSRILLITDPNSVIGVRIRLSENEVYDGQIRGLPDSLHVLLEIKTPRPLPPGTEVLTSPLSTIFPGEFLVGTIRTALPEQGSLLDRYAVSLETDPLQLEDVLVITGRKTHEAMILLQSP